MAWNIWFCEGLSVTADGDTEIDTSTACTCTVVEAVAVRPKVSET
jgi:hypothetical protein